jgi:hypothetical protein
MGIPVEAAPHLAELSRYLHLNPARIRAHSQKGIDFKSRDGARAAPIFPGCHSSRYFRDAFSPSRKTAPRTLPILGEPGNNKKNTETCVQRSVDRIARRRRQG